MQESDGVGSGEGWPGGANSPADRPGDGRRHGGFTLWAARHPVLAALVLSVVMTLLGLAKIILLRVNSSRSVHSSHLSGRKVLIAAGGMEVVFFVMFAALALAVARRRKRSGVALTAEGLNLPFEEDRDAAAHRPPALLVLRPSMRTVIGLATMLPLLAGMLSLVAAVVDVDTGHGSVALWFGMGLVWVAGGVWTTTGHRRQRIVVDSDDVYVYTFTGRYYRTERSRIAALRRTQAEPTLADADGARLVRLPYLTGAQRGELAQVLQVPIRERERAEHSARRGAARSRR
jgi:hypothetical protein